MKLRKLYWIVPLIVILGLFIEYQVTTNAYYNKITKICHRAMGFRAKNQMKIISADIHNGDKNSCVIGKAQFQNGFGAWTNYSYVCVFRREANSTFDYDSSITKGWEFSDLAVELDVCP